jgi:hypothetical protein
VKEGPTYESQYQLNTNTGNTENTENSEITQIAAKVDEGVKNINNKITTQLRQINQIQ